MKNWRRFDLHPQIGRSIQQKPSAMIVAYRYLGLSTGLTAESSLAQGSAVAAVAVPLRKATPCGRAQNFYVHPCRIYIAAEA